MELTSVSQPPQTVPWSKRQITHTSPAPNRLETRPNNLATPSLRTLSTESRYKSAKNLAHIELLYP
jgi:hypothetical protein